MNELQQLREQDEVHWKTRRALLRTIQSVHEVATRAVDIIRDVDNRCMAFDGPVPPTRHMIRDEEMRDIYNDLERIKTLSFTPPPSGDTNG